MGRRIKRKNQELRNFQRATLKVPVEFGPRSTGSEEDPGRPGGEVKGKGGKQIQAVTATVGGGGLFIQTNELLPVGSEIWIRFKLPGEKHLIRAEGLVVWRVNKPHVHPRYSSLGMGIKFLRLEEPADLLIDTYVTQKNRLFRELKFLISQDRPPMRKINELLTSTYIHDYQNIEDLRRQIAAEMTSFRFSRTD